MSCELRAEYKERLIKIYYTSELKMVLDQIQLGYLIKASSGEP